MTENDTLIAVIDRSISLLRHIGWCQDVYVITDEDHQMTAGYCSYCVTGAFIQSLADIHGTPDTEDMMEGICEPVLCGELARLMSVEIQKTHPGLFEKRRDIHNPPYVLWNIVQEWNDLETQTSDKVVLLLKKIYRDLSGKDHETKKYEQVFASGVDRVIVPMWVDWDGCEV